MFNNKYGNAITRNDFQEHLCVWLLVKNATFLAIYQAKAHNVHNLCISHESNQLCKNFVDA